MMLEGFKITQENWRDAIADQPGFENSETPRFIGRADAHLAADPQAQLFNGCSMTSFEAAEIYGGTDLDGSEPELLGETGLKDVVA